MRKIIICLLCCTLLSACTDDKKYAPKEGRLVVFDATETTQAKGMVQLDKTETTSNWTYPLLNSKNRLAHLSQFPDTKPVWKTRIGKPIASARLLPTPLILDESIYALDNTYQLTKLEKETGKIVWQNKLNSAKEGLALTHDKNSLFALSTDGTLVALSLENQELWRKDFNTAFRAAPLVEGGLLYLLTTHNDFIVLNAKDGSEVWRYHTLKPKTLLTHMASPAKSGNTVIVPFSTGEVIAFDAETGLLSWIQMMIGNRPQDLTEIPQIVAAPVIKDGTVYLTGNANLTGAYDLKTGASKWTLNLGSKLTPILSGNALFLLTNQNELLAMNKDTGKFFWRKSIPTNKKLPWKGLLLAQNQLILFNGERVLILDAKNGEQTKELKRDIYAMPIATDTHFITIDSNGYMMRY